MCPTAHPIVDRVNGKLRKQSSTVSWALPPADLDALIQLVTVLGFMFGFMRPAVLRQDRKSAASSASTLARLVVSSLPSSTYR